MISLRKLTVAAITLMLAVLTVGCSSGGGGSSPKPGTISVTVVDGSVSPATPIEAAHILVFDTSTGNPVDTLASSIDGTVSADYYLDSVQLKVSAQGYTSSPATGVQPLPVALSAGQTSAITITLYPLDPALALGTVTGTVRDDQDNVVAGALVVANDGTSSIATTSDDNGNYLLNNVPAGQVDITAWMSGFNFPTLSALTIIDGDTLADQTITATGVATGSVSGHVSFTSISGSVIDITMLEPGTREVLPGLRSYTDGSANYTITNVPNGTFEMIASLENDGYVLDPDTQVTQGVPVVTINDNAITKDFKVTGSIALINPGLVVDGVLPELSATPTFSWVKDSSYASADDYVVELLDESSATIWGGFDPLDKNITPVTVPQGNNPSIVYNGPALEEGRVYQLRVYARTIDSTDGSGNVTAFTLLSASETLDGLFRVAVTTP